MKKIILALSLVAPCLNAMHGAQSNDPLKNNICPARETVVHQQKAQLYEKKSCSLFKTTCAALALGLGTLPISGPLSFLALSVGAVSSWVGIYKHNQCLEARITLWACKEHQKIQQELQENATLNDKLLLMRKKIDEGQPAFNKLLQSTPNTLSDQERHTHQAHVGLLKLNMMIRGDESSPLKEALNEEQMLDFFNLKATQINALLNQD